MRHSGDPARGNAASPELRRSLSTCYFPDSLELPEELPLLGPWRNASS